MRPTRSSFISAFLLSRGDLALAEDQSLRTRDNRSVNELSDVILATKLFIGRDPRELKSQVTDWVTKYKEAETNECFPGESLWWWVVNEIDALLNVALQASLASLKKLFLFVVNVAKNVVGFLGSGGLIFG